MKKKITNFFIDINKDYLNIKSTNIITFSHFLPRIDLMPGFIPPSKKILYPVFGTTLLEKQIRIIKPKIHIYGHSHLNREIKLGNIQYINNAFGYPYETNIAAKRLRCIFEL